MVRFKFSLKGSQSFLLSTFFSRSACIVRNTAKLYNNQRRNIKFSLCERTQVCIDAKWEFRQTCDFQSKRRKHCGTAIKPNMKSCGKLQKWNTQNLGMSEVCKGVPPHFKNLVEQVRSEVLECLFVRAHGRGRTNSAISVRFGRQAPDSFFDRFNNEKEQS